MQLTSLVRIRSLAVLAAPCLGAAAFAQNMLWVVDDDPGPGVDFADVQAAVDAAGAGDAILVRDGQYPAFTIAGKGLTLVGEAGASVVVTATATPVTTLITRVPSDEAVVVRGIDFRPPQHIVGDLVRLAANDGVVWLEDVALESIVPFPFEYDLTQNQALRVEGCAAAILSSSSLDGLSGSAFFGQEFPSVGLSVEDSTAHLFDTSITTGPTLVQGSLGLAGLEVVGSFVSLRGCEVHGGPGGDAGFADMPPPGPGGPGIELDAPSQVWPIGCVVVGGPGGSSIFGGSGAPGIPIENAGGVVSEHAAAPLAFTTPAFVRAGAPAVFAVETDPDVRVFLLASPVPDPVFLPGFPAALGGGALPYVVELERTRSNGRLVFCVGVPHLPPQVEAYRYVLQAMVAVPGFGFQFSRVSVVTVLPDPLWALVAPAAGPSPVLPPGLALEARGERVFCTDEVLPLE